MYQTKDNFKGFPMAMVFLRMLAQSYSHSCLSRTQEGWLPHMDFPIPPLMGKCKSEGELCYARLRLKEGETEFVSIFVQRD